MKNPKTETVKMRADQLRIHPTAQRRISTAMLNKITASLNLDGIGVLHGVRYAVDGTKAVWIVDGQHRLAALMHHGMGEWEVDVQIHKDVKDDAAAADLFLLLNAKASVRPFDRFALELQAEHEDAVDIHRIVEEAGLEVSDSGRDGAIRCVTALKTSYRRHGAEALTACIEAATAAWGRTGSAVENHIITGLSSVFGTYNGAIDRPAFVKKLAKFPGGPAGLLGSAKSLKDLFPKSMATCVHEVAVAHYNKGRRSGILGPGS